MAVPVESKRPPEEELGLHRRLLEGDPTATADLAAAFLDPLVAWLTKKNRAKVAEDLCNEAAEDALIALMKSPTSYSPARMGLWSYLRMSAQGDLQNILRRESRRRRNETTLGAVELSPQAGKYLGREDDPALRLKIQEETATANQAVTPLLDGLTEGEARALDLILQGERKTAVFAQALGIGHLPKEEQKTQVKRVKDKLQKRLQRGRSTDGQPS
jgi:RNA polymerase sigma factor (sigma-70 family)